MILFKCKSDWITPIFTSFQRFLMLKANFIMTYKGLTPLHYHSTSSPTSPLACCVAFCLAFILLCKARFAWGPFHWLSPLSATILLYRCLTSYSPLRLCLNVPFSNEALLKFLAIPSSLNSHGASIILCNTVYYTIYKMYIYILC